MHVWTPGQTWRTRDLQTELRKTVLSAPWRRGGGWGSRFFGAYSVHIQHPV